jgi:hypothetical protein
MKEKTGLGLGWILRQLRIGRSTYYRWQGWRRPEKKGFVHPLKPLKRDVGDTGGGPKSDILGQADAGMRTDRCFDFPA